MKYLLLLLITAGCAGKIRPDYGMPAMDAGYPTAEIIACDSRWNGLASCVLDRSTFSFSIQGYYTGTIQADSGNCNLHEKVRYANSEAKTFSVAPTQSCVIDIIVSPEYPGEGDSGLHISSLKGRIYLSVGNYFVASAKVKATTNNELHVPAKGKKIRTIFRGCNTTFDRELSVKVSYVDVKLSDLIVTDDRKDCIFEGGLAGQTRVAWQVWIYDRLFTSIADPVTEIANHKLKVSSESSISVIALDNTYKISNNATFEFDILKDHVLRLLTIGGRNVIGLWSPQQGEWTWIK